MTAQLSDEKIEEIKKDFTFLKNNKSPFYNIKTGKVSGYNDIGQVMFKTLIEGHEYIEDRFKKNITLARPYKCTLVRESHLFHSASLLCLILTL